MSDAAGFRRVGELIDDLLPPSRGGGALLPIVRAWDAVVGPAIARETFPVRLSDRGELMVHASSAIWVSELTLLAGGIVEQLGEALGDWAPRSLRFRVGPLPNRSGPAAPARPRPVPARARREASSLAAVIADDDLREAAEAAIARALVPRS